MQSCTIFFYTDYLVINAHIILMTNSFLPSLSFDKAAPARVDAAELKFVKHDPALCAFPGLFRFVDPARRGQSIGLKLKYEHGDTTVEVHNSTPMDGIDLAVLQAIVSLATVHGATVDPAQALGADEKKLVAALEASTAAKPDELTQQVQHVDFSATNLLEIIGLPACGQHRALIKASVVRLSTCVLRVYPTSNPLAWHRSFLLSTICTRASSSKWRRTHVTLNPRLTEVILGAESRYTRISLGETRLLGTDQIARLLHQRLCAWIDDGSTREVSYNKLLEYVWPDDEVTRTADAAQRGADNEFVKLSSLRVRQQRLLKIREAMLKLAQLPGWSTNLKSQRKFKPDAAHTIDQTAEALRAHQIYCQASARAAQKDVFDTVLDVRRAYLAKLSNG